MLCDFHSFSQSIDRFIMLTQRCMNSGQALQRSPYPRHISRALSHFLSFCIHIGGLIIAAECS